jgi:hypothetical protein
VPFIDEASCAVVAPAIISPHAPAHCYVDVHLVLLQDLVHCQGYPTCYHVALTNMGPTIEPLDHWDPRSFIHLKPNVLTPPVIQYG